MSKSHRVKKPDNTDLYQKVTDRIVQALEKGAAPWRKPWRSTVKSSSSGPLPVNVLTGNFYSGVNVLLLWMATEEKGFKTDCWLTYRQAQTLGGQVRKGEISTETVIFMPYETQAEDANGNKLFDADGKPLRVQRTMLKPNFLFNIDQCDGLPANIVTRPHSSSVSELPGAVGMSTKKRVLAMVHKMGLTIHFRPQNRACYSRRSDSVMMPEAEQFFTPADYWSTLLHEMVHATGHEKRLSREGITLPLKKFGDPVYAFEELIAEMGSAFLCAQLGVFGDVQHDSYIQSWLTVLKEDKRALFRACRHAREASEFLLQHTSAGVKAA